MEALATCFTDDLLNFSLDGENEETTAAAGVSVTGKLSCSSLESSNPSSQQPADCSRSYPESLIEEDLEWLSNKDVFPPIETSWSILPTDSLSPLSVLENSSNGSTVTSCCSGLPARGPVRQRSKRKRKPRKKFVQFPTPNNEVKVKKHNRKQCSSSSSNSTNARRCLHCQAEKTPQWRAGPDGPKTLCNACGVRYKSGRLVPEYRPASSPTFLSSAHSNSHRKIIEMRRQKQMLN